MKFLILLACVALAANNALAARRSHLQSKRQILPLSNDVYSSHQHSSGYGDAQVVALNFDSNSYSQQGAGAISAYSVPVVSVGYGGYSGGLAGGYSTGLVGGYSGGIISGLGGYTQQTAYSAVPVVAVPQQTQQYHVLQVPVQTTQPVYTAHIQAPQPQINYLIIPNAKSEHHEEHTKSTQTYPSSYQATTPSYPPTTAKSLYDAPTTTSRPYDIESSFKDSADDGYNYSPPKSSSSYQQPSNSYLPASQSSSSSYGYGGDASRKVFNRVRFNAGRQ